MTIYYQAVFSINEIRAANVTDESKTHIWIDGVKCKRMPEKGTFHKTWKAARDALRKHKREQITKTKAAHAAQLDGLQDQLNAIVAMKPPKNRPTKTGACL